MFCCLWIESHEAHDDIPTTLPVPTSPNTWKVRLALNYKGLSYETRWVETVDIESVCKSLGIPPTSISPSNVPKYTLPAIVDRTRSEHVAVSDSTPIIEYLERTYPDPDPRRTLCPPLASALHALFEHYLATSITGHLLPLMVMHMYDKKTPRDRVYFRQRMEAAYGQKLEDIELKEPQRTQAWKRIEKAVDSLATAMTKNTQGEFFSGERLTLADCALGGLLLAMKYDSPDEALIELNSWSGGRWRRYLEALERWIVVI
ncbi:glutathione S-transferase [Melanogaster broomeanus]|nr:glutathione S-transferase [Melanogaster broomeanus]